NEDDDDRVLAEAVAAHSTPARAGRGWRPARRAWASASSALENEAMSPPRGTVVHYHAPMEPDGRFERELEIAREVQGRLFPRAVPQLERLELAAACIQARAVGGDYYDFLDLGSRQFGFV